MKDIHLKYGRKKIHLHVPSRAQQLVFKEPIFAIEKRSFVTRFKELLAERNVSGDVAIIIADKTRLCGYDTILPWVVETFGEHGVSSEQISFYIAYGTHPRQSDEECRAAYGEVYDNCRFVHHDCNDREAFVDLGSTSRGTHAELRRDVVESDLILTIGAVSHHYFAGYGGGRKLLFPGVAEKTAIYSNHRLFLDEEKRGLAKGCWPGNLDGNPLAADLKEVNDMLPEYLSIHAILDSSGKPARYSFGEDYEDFLTVCRELDGYYCVDVDEQFDLVVASAGGYPKDINIIQAHKSIHNAANLVKNGGTLIILAECMDGVGSQTFLPYFRKGSWKNTFNELLGKYVGNGGTALAMMEKTRRISISMMTALEKEICSEIGVNNISAEMADGILQNHSGTIAVVDNGSLLVSKRQ
jgi:nickel-dependent lactate racemase